MKTLLFILSLSIWSPSFAVSVSPFDSLVGGTAPVATQTPTGNVGTAYVGVGDSYTQGQVADPITNGFAYLLTTQLNIWYPTTQLIDYGYIGYTAYDYQTGPMATNISNIAGYGFGSASRITIWFGINDVTFVVNSVSEPGAAATATLANGTTYSQVYKTQMQAIITAYRNAYPSAVILLPNIPDLSTLGGGGWVAVDPAQWPDYVGVLAQYNARNTELVANNSNCFGVNIYTAMYGRSAWYDQTNAHPNNTGHMILAGEIGKQFSSPPR